MNQQTKQDSEYTTPSQATRLRQGLLGQHIRNLSLSHNQPALYDTLNTLLSTAVPLRQDMEESLDQLKEAFLETLYDILAEGGIDLQERLVIGFCEGGLGVADRAHPHAGKVDKLLSRAPMLTAALRQIAADALMLRSLDALHQAFSLCRIERDALYDALIESYQVCIKGELSHFYYT